MSACHPTGEARPLAAKRGCRKNKSNMAPEGKEEQPKQYLGFVKGFTWGPCSPLEEEKRGRICPHLLKTLFWAVDVCLWKGIVLIESHLDSEWTCILFRMFFYHYTLHVQANKTMEYSIYFKSFMECTKPKQYGDGAKKSQIYSIPFVQTLWKHLYLWLLASYKDAVVQDCCYDWSTGKILWLQGSLATKCLKQC